MNDGQEGTFIHQIHLLYLRALVFLIILNDTQRIDPQVSFAKFAHALNSILNSLDHPLLVISQYTRNEQLFYY